MNDEAIPDRTIPDRTVVDRSTYDGAADGFDSYALALKCQRERGIRSGVIAPLPDRPHEVRWAQEGPRATNQLDTVTGKGGGRVTALARYDEACRALAEAKTLDEVTGISDKAAALQEYYRRAGNRQLEIDAAELRLRAERRAGQLLLDLKAEGRLSAGGRPLKADDDEADDDKTGASAEPVSGGPVTLADLGVDKKFSARAQKSAGIADAAYEEMIARWRGTAEQHAGRLSLALTNTTDKKERRAERERDLGARQRALPEKRYGVIFADPEWRFDPRSRETGMDRLPDNHYPTSPTEEIALRPVGDIAADDAVLFLWATPPMLDDAIIVMGAWDFEYVTCIVWRKMYPGQQLGTGYWFRFEHELLLIGKRGDVPAPAPGTQWRSVIEAPVGRHSEKPAIFRALIDEYFPSLPKIELNYRDDGNGPPAGWDVWGFEAGDECAAATEGASDAGN